MIVTIDDIKLLDIAAISTLSDKTTKYIYETINFVLNNEHKKMKRICQKINDFDVMEENKIDFILNELSTSFTGLKLSEKKDLLRQALFLKSNEGVSAVLKTICQIQYQGFKLKEWYEYNGRPGTFKVEFNKKIKSEKEFRSFMETVNNNKNVRSHLDSTEYKDLKITNYYVGGYKEIVSSISKEKRIKDIDINTDYYIKAYKEIIGGRENEI